MLTTIFTAALVLSLAPATVVGVQPTSDPATDLVTVEDNRGCLWDCYATQVELGDKVTIVLNDKGNNKYLYDDEVVGLVKGNAELGKCPFRSTLGYYQPLTVTPLPKANVVFNIYE